MNVLYKSISIPIYSNSPEEKELNTFLAGNQIIEVEKEFIADAGNSKWVFLISYLKDPGRPMG